MHCNIARMANAAYNCTTTGCFPADAGHARHRAAAVSRSARSADPQSARPYRSALVRGQRAVHATRPSCCSRRITTCIACSTARASISTTLGVASRRGPLRRDPRAAWRTVRERTSICFAARRRALWLNYVFAKVFGLEVRARGRRPPITTSTPSARSSRRPAFRPRALFERFNIEVLATTESPVDTLEHHHAIREQRLARPRDHRVSSRRRHRSGARGISPRRWSASAS